MNPSGLQRFANVLRKPAVAEGSGLGVGGDGGGYMYDLTRLVLHIARPRMQKLTFAFENS